MIGRIVSFPVFQGFVETTLAWICLKHRNTNPQQKKSHRNHPREKDREPKPLQKHYSTESLGKKNNNKQKHINRQQNLGRVLYIQSYPKHPVPPPGEVIFKNTLPVEDVFFFFFSIPKPLKALEKQTKQKKI